MSISKNMTGTSWHIEKINGTNKSKRSCFNCKYHDDGGWCSRQKIQCTNNNAPICKAYFNKYNNQKNKPKKDKKIKSMKNSVQNKTYISQSTYRYKMVNIFIYPTDEKFNDIVNIDKSIDIFIKTNLIKNMNYDFDLQRVFLKSKSGKYYEIFFNHSNNEIIKSNEYITVSFSYTRIQKAKVIPKKSSRICYGKDSVYGLIELKLV